MKFEFFIALKYLFPRRGRLSSSFISIFSVGVISLVVWLSVVFLSVIGGVEKRWTRDLSRLHSPVKISPTDRYYRSYYYRIDAYSERTNYTSQTLGQKLSSGRGGVLVEDIDLGLPEDFPAPVLDQDGNLLDPVRLLKKSILPVVQKYHGEFREYEETIGQISFQTEMKKGRREDLFKGFFKIASYDLLHSRRNLLLPYRPLDYLSLPLKTQPRETSWEGDFQTLSSRYLGQGIVLPIGYAEAGYRVGEEGKINFSFLQKTFSFPVVVIGFYNPGLSPLGSKTVFIDSDLMEAIRDAISQNASCHIQDSFDLYFEQFGLIEKVKQEITDSLEALGIGEYWEVESLYDYEQFQPILSQLKSDKILFLILAVIILIVACSNIITMLILLVNDKKREIGILMAMGATPEQLRRIFGICGAISGGVGAVLGVCFSIPTLKYLNQIISFVGRFSQVSFNKQFFGSTLPTDLEWSTIGVISLATLILSVISGVLPSIKVSKVQVAEILKSE